MVHSVPSLADIRSAILEVAEEKGLSPRWLNDDVKAFGDVLSEDFEERLDRMGVFGNLRVLLLGRKDLILSKFFSGRVVDFEDLTQMCPTDEEVAFVINQLERIARFRPDKALKIELYLEQGGGVALQDSPTIDEPKERGDQTPDSGTKRGGP